MPFIVHMIAMLPSVVASCLISAIWQGMVLAIGVTLCLHLLPETTAAIRSIIWSAAFVLVIALYVAGTMTSSPSIHRVSQWIRDPPRCSLGHGDCGSVDSDVDGSRITACDERASLAKNCKPGNAC